MRFQKGVAFIIAIVMCIGSFIPSELFKERAIADSAESDRLPSLGLQMSYDNATDDGRMMASAILTYDPGSGTLYNPVCKNVSLTIIGANGLEPSLTLYSLASLSKQASFSFELLYQDADEPPYIRDDPPSLTITAFSDSGVGFEYQCVMDVQPVTRALIITNRDPGNSLGMFNQNSSDTFLEGIKQGPYYGKEVLFLLDKSTNNHISLTDKKLDEHSTDRLIEMQKETREFVSDIELVSCFDTDDNDLTYVYISTHGLFDKSYKGTPRLELNGGDGSFEADIRDIISYIQANVKGRVVLLLDYCFSGQGVALSESLDVDSEKYLVISATSDKNTLSGGLSATSFGALLGAYKNSSQLLGKNLKEFWPRWSVFWRDLIDGLVGIFQRFAVLGIMDETLIRSAWLQFYNSDDLSVIDTLNKAFHESYSVRYGFGPRSELDPQFYGNEDLPIFPGSNGFDDHFRHLVVKEEHFEPFSTALSGNVRDKETGEPLADVFVRVQVGKKVYSARTNEKGQFTLGLNAGENVELFLTKDHYFPLSDQYPVILDRNNVILDPFMMEPCITLTGNVQDKETREPIQAAQVLCSYVYQDQAKQSVAFTEENGQFTISLNKTDSVNLLVSKEGYLPLEEEWPVTSNSVNVIMDPLLLIPGIQVSGMVLDEETNLPIEGAAVELSIGEEKYSITTDMAGSFSAHIRSRGDMKIHIMKAGYEDTNAQVTIPEEIFRIETGPFMMRKSDIKFGTTMYLDDHARLHLLHTDGYTTFNGSNEYPGIYQSITYKAGITTEGQFVSFANEIPTTANQIMETVLSGDNVIQAVSSPSSQFCVALKQDGNIVVTVMDKLSGKVADSLVKAEEWTDIVQIDCSGLIIVGLKSDGTVVNTDLEKYDYVKQWTGIEKVVAGSSYIAGIRTDGTVLVEVDRNNTHTNKMLKVAQDLRDAESWTNIKKLAASKTYGSCLAGLKYDGTVIMIENPYQNYSEYQNWTNIVDLCVCGDCIVGLKSDGTLVIDGNRKNERIMSIPISEITDVACGN